MARVYGVEFPERPLMAVLSDLLGIRHFTTARGSTVRRDFLEAVARRLGVRAPERLATKDQVLAACVVAATRQPMRIEYYSPGATVTDKTLQLIIDGVIQNWRLGPSGGPAPSGPDGPPVLPFAGSDDAPGQDPAPPAPQVADPLDAPPAGDGLPTGQDALNMPDEDLADLLDPDALLGPVDRRLVVAAYREGQDAFRAAVLQAYRQDLVEACCVTGHGPPQVLQAAHIIGHAEGGLSIVSNGLSLRADIHVLMDRQLLAIHEQTYEVLVHPVLGPTPYGDLAGQKVHVPHARADRPAPAALRHRREAAGL